MSQPDPSTRLSDRRLLTRNSILNLMGSGAPLLVAVVAIPLLILTIGGDRFGILALAWTLIGYFTVLDLGLGRSLTQVVSDRLGVRRETEIPALAWTAFLVLLGLGVMGGILLALLTPPLVTRFLNVPPTLQDESLRAFRILALALPAVISATGIRGILEAYQRFDLVNAIRIPTGVFTFLGPLVTVFFSTDLGTIVAVLAAGRAATWLAYLIVCLWVIPDVRKQRQVDLSTLPHLLRLGGWITVSNLISPLMVYFDRFLIGGVLTMAAVAYYATPYEVVTKILVLPVAITAVFFPAFALSHRQEPQRTGELFEGAVRAIFLIIFPLTLAILTLGGIGLELWVGRDFAVNGLRVAQWLAVGVFFNALAQVPFALVQGTGRPDITARIHMLEAPFYLLLLWWALGEFGIAGAAFAWTTRAAVDATILFAASRWLLPETTGAVRLTLFWSVPSLLAFGLVVWLGEVVGPLPGVVGILLFLLWIGRDWIRNNRRWRLAGILVLVAAAFLRPVAGTGQESSFPASVRHEVFVNSELEAYLRLLQLLDLSRDYPWSIRSFSPREVADLAPTDREHPWLRRFSLEAPDSADGLQFRWVRSRSRSVFNTSFPFGYNDGPRWAGKGLTLDLQAGMAASWGPLSLTLAPVAFWTQNGSFDLMDTGQTGDLAYADPRYPTFIDSPQRFGDGGYARVDLGETTLRLDHPWITAGLSTASQHWGPARRFPLILGSNAPGFLHGFVGTGSPANVGIGTLHGRIVWGRLEQSEYTDISGLDATRFVAAAVAVFSPRGVRGLEVGGARFFHLPWREGGPSSSDILRPIEALFKSRLSASERAADTARVHRENQIVSAFARWSFPASGFEVYGEFAREDHSWNLRDLLMEPEQNSGYMLGLSKAWHRQGGEILTLSAEVMNARVSQIGQIRDQAPLYRHTKVRQGHTHRGQILGSPAAYGGAGAVVAVERYHPGGKWRAYWERELRNEGRNEEGEWVQDVLHSLGAEILLFRGPWELSGSIAGTWELNRNLGSDAFNLRGTVGLVWDFHHR